MRSLSLVLLPSFPFSMPGFLSDRSFLCCRKQAADIAARHESALEAVADSAAAVEEGEGDRALKYALAAVRALVGDDGAPVRDTPGLDDDSCHHLSL